MNSQAGEAREAPEVGTVPGDSGRSFALGLLVGALIGLAIAILYAPRPGKETRRILKEKAKAVRAAAGDAAEK